MEHTERWADLVGGLAALVYVREHALRRLAHEHGGAGGAEVAGEHKNEVSQQDGQDDVHGGAGGQDDGPLPRRLLVEDAILVAWFDLLERRHPDDLDEAAGGDRFDAVLGLTAMRRPQR